MHALRADASRKIQIHNAIKKWALGALRGSASGAHKYIKSHESPYSEGPYIDNSGHAIDDPDKLIAHKAGKWAPR